MDDLHALCWFPIQENFGTDFQVEIGGELKTLRGLFKNASSRIAIESGEYAVAIDPTLVLPIAAGKGVRVGMKVLVHEVAYQILTKFVDEPKGVVTCDLAKAKN